MVLHEVIRLTTPSTGSTTEIKDLATIFNQITKSKRKLIPDFYDCGTTARAIFLQLIRLHRGNISLSEKEVQKMCDQYKASKNDEANLNVAIATIKRMKPGVVILSLAFWMDEHGDNQSGHVWIIEKLNQNKYNIYQSALDRYLVLDFYQNYGNDIDAVLLLENLRPFLKAKKWTPKNAELFTEIFKFTPNIAYKTDVSPKFFWTYIEY
jgi:hypothetical protein